MTCNGWRSIFVKTFPLSRFTARRQVRRSPRPGRTGGTSTSDLGRAKQGIALLEGDVEKGAGDDEEESDDEDR